MKIVSFSLEQGNEYFGRVDGGPKFHIGKRVSYLGNKGLANVKGTPSQKYDRAAYRLTHGYWADFIHPTSVCEGAFFHTLNSYDRAQFTFSFMQFAAHVPNGDFVVYFRTVLQLPGAADYFPDLRVESGRIVHLTDAGNVALETSQTTNPLMQYLNPSMQQVEDTEVIQSARFIHWVQNDSVHRDKMVDIAVSQMRLRMADYAQRYGLDGAADTICLVIADIRHQGRATSSTILNALNKPNPLDALLNVGKENYSNRVATLRREVKKLVDEGTLGKKRYKTESKDFV